MSAVELRYAEALSEAVPVGSDEGIGSALDGFCALMTGKSDLREFLLDPTVPAAVKKDTTEKLMGNDAMLIIKNFINTLIDKGRLALLPSINDAYKKLNAERNNNPDINIYSALPLDESQVTEIRDKYRKLYNIPTARVQLSIDSKLLGGVMVRIGDVCVDGTLLGRLTGLRSVLERK